MSLCIYVIHAQDHLIVVSALFGICDLRFRAMFVAGEHCDDDTIQWAKDLLGVPVLDHWWQTGLCHMTLLF